MPSTTTREVPAAACRFAADVDVTPTADGKRARVKIFARSNQPVSHWYWGRVVHDMEGMQNKPTIPLDYCHRDDELLGHADQFDADPATGLTLGANVIPFTADDRASEVLFRAAQGTPYEASINFADPDMQIEVLAENQVATVNGYTFEGPGAIIRKWKLRGCALCPYGYDADSSAQFAAAKAAGQTIPVTFTQSQSSPTMPEATATKPTDEKPTDQQPTAETSASEDAEQTGAEHEAAAATTSAAPEAAQLTAPGQKFLDAFGDKGALYFAQGKSFEEAQALFAKDTRAEVEQLRAANDKLTKQFAALRGEAPLSGADNEPDRKPEAAAAAKFAAAGVTDNVAKIAAAIKLPKK